MKKALIVSSTGGFLSQFLENDVQVLQEKGYEIHYASDFDNPVYEFNPEALRNEGIIMHQIVMHKKPWHLIKNTKGLIQLSELINKEDICLVHCHNPVGGMLGRLSGFCSGRHPYVIYTSHGFHFFKGAPKSYWLIFYPIERFLARFTDMIITINKEDYKRACGFKLRKGGHVELLHGVGLDTKRFHPMPEKRDAVRKELGIPKNGFHIVTAAELNNNKNQMAVIEAIRELDDENIYYSICGRGGKYKELKSFVKTNGMAGNIKLLGYRKDMERVLQSADVFAFPSKREGFGMAAVEALSCAVPVIAADNRGTREYMKNGENGIVCRAEDIKDYERAIVTIKNNSDIREAYSKKALELSADFSKEKSKETMREIYSKIV
ncbi:glycosyltransferase family 4 protein [Butyrivibrio sp. FC2001]|uniref:glycosyltransferase family 4 protein n=1 Tax=Butyrivibrio sp. FC2001 TaxID=1280671 RepID=UPI0005630B8A|nr:glycosyltransferase family 4 protein [Butyrivibrio sp. FC2001]